MLSICRKWAANAAGIAYNVQKFVCTRSGGHANATLTWSNTRALKPAKDLCVRFGRARRCRRVAVHRETRRLGHLRVRPGAQQRPHLIRSAPALSSVHVKEIHGIFLVYSGDRISPQNQNLYLHKDSKYYTIYNTCLLVLYCLKLICMWLIDTYKNLLIFLAFLSTFIQKR